MARIKIALLQAGAPIEVLVINGGAERVATTLIKKGDSYEEDIAAPQAIVLREDPTYVPPEAPEAQ
jgi:hypothetical protein